jgi:hypothetical protein
MNIYSILVFFHVLGAVGIFAALGIEAAAFGRFRGAQTPVDVRTWMGLMAVNSRLGPITLLTTLVTGLAMMKWWGPKPWVIGALAFVVLLGILGGAITGRRMRSLGVALGAETDARLSPAFRALQTADVLTMSLRMRMTILVGMLALMTFKPGVVGSLLIMAAMVALALVAAVLAVVNDASRPRAAMDAGSKGA